MFSGYALGFGLRLLLGGVFIAAALPKILDPAEFALIIYRYQLVPSGLENVLAVFLPWIELIAAMTLICMPRFADAAAALILVLLMVFIAALLANIYRGIDVSCGCFSVAANTSSITPGGTGEASGGGGGGGLWWNVGRNLGLMLIAVLCWRHRCKQTRLIL